jgi:hypothetical protein
MKRRLMYENYIKRRAGKDFGREYRDLLQDTNPEFTSSYQKP